MKDPVRKKRQSTDWEKVFATYPVKDNIYKELSNSQVKNQKRYSLSKYENHMKKKSEKLNNPIRKWAKYMKRYFTEEDAKMAAKHMKKFSKSLVIREMQIETTETYFHVPIRITKLKSCENTRCC